MRVIYRCVTNDAYDQLKSVVEERLGRTLEIEMARVEPEGTPTFPFPVLVHYRVESNDACNLLQSLVSEQAVPGCKLDDVVFDCEEKKASVEKKAYKEPRQRRGVVQGAVLQAVRNNPGLCLRRLLQLPALQSFKANSIDTALETLRRTRRVRRADGPSGAYSVIKGAGFNFDPPSTGGDKPYKQKRPGGKATGVTGKECIIEYAETQPDGRITRGDLVKYAKNKHGFAEGTMSSKVSQLVGEGRLRHGGEGVYYLNGATHE